MADLTILVAIFLSFGAAIAIACTNLFVRKGTDTGSASDAVYVVMVVEVIILTAPVLIIYYPSYGLTRGSIGSFIAAGIVGTLLGQVFHFSSIKHIGASRTAPIVAGWVLVSTAFGVVLLGETVTSVHAVGIVLVVSGAAAIAWETSHENPGNLTRRELAVGLIFPFAAAIAYGVEPILAKYGFAEGTPAPVGLVVKTIAAFLGFTIYLRWRNKLPNLKLSKSDDVYWFVLAGITTTLFLLGYYIALEIAPVSLVTPIIITNTLFVVLLSALVMPQRLERVTWKLVVSAVVVVFGILIITVNV